MSPDTALKILDNAVSQVTASRADHQTLLNAVSILQEFIDSKTVSVGSAANKKS